VLFTVDDPKPVEIGNATQNLETGVVWGQLGITEGHWMWHLWTVHTQLSTVAFYNN